MVFTIPFNYEEIPDWEFEKHCSQIKPETLSTKDLGYSFDTFAITKPFKILTDEAIEICRHIILHDNNRGAHASQIFKMDRTQTIAVSKNGSQNRTQI